MTKISRRKAGCGESRTSGLGEGMRKHARALGAVRRIPIPHFGQIEAFFGADRKLAGILAPHVGKFFKSDALLKLPNGMIWAKETSRIDKLPLPKDTPMGRSQKEGEDND